MAFSAFGMIDDVARRYVIHYSRQAFLEAESYPTPSDHFRQDIDFILQRFTYGRTEDSACESLIFPLLREVWKSYHQQLSLSSARVTISPQGRSSSMPSYRASPIIS